MSILGGIIVIVFALLLIKGTIDSCTCTDEYVYKIVEKAINNLVESSKQRQLERQREEEEQEYEEAMRRRKMNRELDKYYTLIKNRGY